MLFYHPQIYKCFWIGDALGMNWGWVVFFTACKINLRVFNDSYQMLFKIK